MVVLCRSSVRWMGGNLSMEDLAGSKKCARALEWWIFVELVRVDRKIEVTNVC